MIGVVLVGVGLDRIDEHLGAEDVVAHRRERLLGIVGRAGRVGGLFDERADASRLVGVDDTERARFGARHPDTRDRGTRAALDVELEHLLRVHPVDVVGTEHNDVVGVLVVDQVQRLQRWRPRNRCTTAGRGAAVRAPA